MAIWQLGFYHYLLLINQSRLRLKSKNEMLFTSKASLLLQLQLD